MTIPNTLRGEPAITADLLQYVDGALLVDLWPEHVLPRDLRAAWQPVIDSFISGLGTTPLVISAFPRAMIR